MNTPSESTRSFKRVILKLSGEALREPGSTDNISPEIVDRIATEVKESMETGIELGIVVGGGNFWRGATLPFFSCAFLFHSTSECWPR